MVGAESCSYESDIYIACGMANKINVIELAELCLSEASAARLARRRTAGRRQRAASRNQRSEVREQMTEILLWERLSSRDLAI